VRKTTFALLVALGLLMAVPAFATQEIFTDPIIIKDNWDGAVSVYATDMDSDGDTDIVACALYASQIIWWENTGGKPPSFTEHTIREGFDRARWVYATDVNGDGYTDVLGIAQRGDQITWWQNTPNGNAPPADPITWTEHTIEDDFDEAFSVYAADVDGDGDTDVLGAASWYAADVTWWENNPSGNPPPADPVTWTEHSISDDFNGAGCVYAADVDGDGDTDVLGTGHLAKAVTWWENDGGAPPSFAEHTIRGNLDGASFVRAEDLDGDGDTDVLGTATSAGDVIWWENDGGSPPGFIEHAVDLDFWGANSVHAIDMDGDNDMDVVAAASGDCEIAWWENTPSGNASPGDPFTWTKHTVHYDERKPHGVYAADLDGDDDPDILAAVHHGGYVAWWENRTNDLPPGRIAFVSRRDGDIEIYTMNSHGSDVRRLTEHPGADIAPAWSPDGSEIVFARGYGGDATEIWVMDTAGNLLRQLGGSYDHVREPRWSPDGSQIVFVMGGGTDAHLYLVPSDASGPPTQLTNTCGGEAGPDWAPDGNTIVFHADPVGCSYDTADTHLHLIDPDGSNLRPLLDGEGQKIHGSYARYSPDGTLTAFERYHRDPGGADCDIYIVNSDGSDVRPFQVGPYDDGLPVWSPDGQTLAFMSSNRAATYVDIWVARLDDQARPIQLTTDPASDIAWDWWGPRPDSTPPTTTIDVDGTLGSDDWYVSTATVTLSAADEPGGSGVAYTEYSTDGGDTWTTYTEPFTIAEVGVTGILARSADNAGNLEDPPVGEEVKVVLECQVLFHEDFSSDLNQWTLFGSPLSYIDTSLGNLVPSLQTNGDANYGSGLNSVEGFALTPGTTIVYHGRLERLAWHNAFAVIPYRDWTCGEYTGDYAARFEYGSSCPDGFCLQAAVRDSATTYEHSPNLPALAPRLFHDFKIEILEDSRVSFYADDMSTPAWTSSVSVDTSYGTGPLCLNGRKAWLDNVTVISCDITPPTTTIDVDGTLGDNGWYVSPVTVTMSAIDEPGGSGVALIEYSLEGGAWTTYVEPFTIEVEGPTAIRAYSEDNADNPEDPPVSEEVRIDFTPPTIAGTPLPDPNANGWNNEDVTVYFECSDATSGVVSCPDDTTLSNENAGQSLTGEAVDLAGNRASATVGDINIDKTAPAATANASPEPNANGWNNTDVTITFSGLDDLSGIDYCSEPTILSSDGAGQSASGICTDKAGSPSAAATASGINIDMTSPEIAVTRTPAANPNGWNSGEVTVQFDCEDPLSGVAFCPPDFALSAEGAGQSASGTAVDLAGNTASAAVSNINIDLTDPTIMGSREPAANTYGWNNEDVTVSFECNDALSGVAFCTSGTVLSDEGEGQSVTGSAMDLAGNGATTTVTDISIDKTAPTANIADLFPNPADVSESADLVAHLVDELSGIQAAQWCAESESLACTWEAMTLTGEAGDLNRTASSRISGLPPGVYSIKVNTQDLADNSSDVAQVFLVVYDSRAGFATGGGWIIPGTEPGDLLPGITGENKANFGFVVKYKKGATTPDGQLEFHNRVGDFNLHSTEMHWMVINGNWAKFQGYATINLHPDELFYFRVDARDGNLDGGNQPDRFVVKVWTSDQDPDLDDPVYRASGDLMGGNIIIHTK